MKARSMPAIALTESNDKGGFFFMSLHTGKKLHSCNWKELPIDDEVIARVEALATKDLNEKYPMFEWKPGVPILDEDEIPVLDHEENETNNDDDIGVNDDVEEPIILNGDENDEDIDINNDDDDDNEENRAYITEDEIEDNDDQNETKNDDELDMELADDPEQEQSNMQLDIINEEENEEETINLELMIEDKVLDKNLMEIEERDTDIEMQDINNSDEDVEMDDSNNLPPTAPTGRPKRKAEMTGIDRLAMDIGGKRYFTVKQRQFLMKKI
eukprot:CAMPEP_0195514222 /NCGR_PEP_ID=MMETSP0794_2-20130614/5672_1 /TAXON_ID=515487 /ORGANISM="Stephanopyxis turris, Strain CCMP 815" /LENGTH=270 /DNA_ID=CAMNT_0040642419 /DNA_START=1033 /DNA_END=1845 /DNA_ORIENTATION=+